MQNEETFRSKFIARLIVTNLLESFNKGIFILKYRSSNVNFQNKLTATRTQESLTM